MGILEAAQVEQLLNEVLGGDEIKVYSADQIGRRFIVMNLTTEEAINLLWLFRGDDQFSVAESPSNRELLKTLVRRIQEKRWRALLRKSLMIEVNP